MYRLTALEMRHPSQTVATAISLVCPIPTLMKITVVVFHLPVMEQGYDQSTASGETRNLLLTMQGAGVICPSPSPSILATTRGARVARYESYPSAADTNHLCAGVNAWVRDLP